MAGFANFTQQCTTRYYPDQNFFGLAKECFIEEWDRTFDYDQEFNNCKIPTTNYTYQGTKVINGKRCNGFKFIAVNAPNPAGNIMWTQIETENAQQPPVRMDILHNGRSIVYSNFKVPALDFVINEADQFCTSISQDKGAPCKNFKDEL